MISDLKTQLQNLENDLLAVAPYTVQLGCLYCACSYVATFSTQDAAVVVCLRESVSTALFDEDRFAMSRKLLSLNKHLTRSENSEILQPEEPFLFLERSKPWVDSGYWIGKILVGERIRWLCWKPGHGGFQLKRWRENQEGTPKK